MVELASNDSPALAQKLYAAFFRNGVYKLNDIANLPIAEIVTSLVPGDNAF